ncbi:RNA polymerase sigma factor [Spirosoma linguale]|uniref:RNA polymerase, sigma-24 subunit, ECF subfamily n=1 Tax=Spirosoma linguale (strain ATCC 33905 / DSM 74 / LMG 10896 / Claus 1) TaxID=504472 RepID=D2QCV5_SPILD|nr:RNA polymerase, sigma-24 subunit, ECF subfamily [Spirosoma linguale DSM 74]
MPLHEEEFTQIYNTHFVKVLRLCKGYVNGDQAIATDLAQEVFMKVWQHRSQFRQEASVSTWIYRIAVNTRLLQRRKAAANKEVQTDTLPERAEDNDALATEERFQQMYRGIYQLNETARLIILLVLDGLPYEEIAGIVGISESLLRVKIHRIKKSLATLIQS